MRQIYNTGVTPQEKIVGVNNKFGNTGIKSQQGTSRIIYDSLATKSTAGTYRFFEDSSSRVFPLTNTGSDGNKLGVGDTMVIEKILFFLYKYNPTTKVYTKSPLYGPNAVNGAQTLGLFNFFIANNQVIKNMMLTEANANTGGTSDFKTYLELETQIVIPPLLNYVLELRLPFESDTQDFEFIQCQIVGTAGIIAPRTTF
jgi:hypothetical protein